MSPHHTSFVCTRAYLPLAYAGPLTCTYEIQWALQAERKIVPVCAQDDKKRVKDFIDDGKKYDIDFSEFNFVVHHARIPLL